MERIQRITKLNIAILPPIFRTKQFMNYYVRKLTEKKKKRQNSLLTTATDHVIFRYPYTRGIEAKCTELQFFFLRRIQIIFKFFSFFFVFFLNVSRF